MPMAVPAAARGACGWSLRTAGESCWLRRAEPRRRGALSVAGCCSSASSSVNRRPLFTASCAAFARDSASSFVLSSTVRRSMSTFRASRRFSYCIVEINSFEKHRVEQSTRKTILILRTQSVPCRHAKWPNHRSMRWALVAASVTWRVPRARASGRWLPERAPFPLPSAPIRGPSVARWHAAVC